MRIQSLLLAGLGLASAASADFYLKGTVSSATGSVLDSVQVLTKWGLSADTTDTQGVFSFGNLPVSSVRGGLRAQGLSATLQGSVLSIAAPSGAVAELLSPSGRRVASFEAGRVRSFSAGRLSAGAYVLRVRGTSGSSSLSFQWKGGDLGVSTRLAETSVAARTAADSAVVATGTDTTLTFYRRGYYPKSVAVASGDTAIAVSLTAFDTTSSCVTDGKIALEITSNCYLAKGTYSLQGLTFVDSGAVLAIEPGVTIKGGVDDAGTSILSAFIAKPKARIYALGTPDAPVVFTAGTAEPEPGDFGGVVLLGRATENFAGDTAAIEGLNGIYYGGSDDADTSGEFRYVRIEYAGYILGTNNELNGLTFGGVGNGTRISYVQVYRGLDDCFEWFGGAVSADHLVCTEEDDDMFDFDAGWHGTLQFAFGAAGASNNDANGIESDNNVEASQELMPRTNPVVRNMTVIGNGGNYGSNRSLHGMRLRRGMAGDIGNVLVAGGFQYGLGVDGNTSFRLVLNDSLKAAGVRVSEVYTKILNNKILAGAGSVVAGLDSAALVDSVKKIVNNEWLLADTASTGITAWAPVPAAAITGAIATPSGMQPADYIGAFEPGTTTLWHEGWTLDLREPTAVAQ